MNVLFVCLGNICRSPSAEAVFRHRVEALGLSNAFHIDSAGTLDWHQGNPPDPRSITHGEARGYALQHLKSRPIVASDFDTFDHIWVMDAKNLADVMALAPEHAQHKVKRLLSIAPQLEVEDVPDPYYGGADGFNHVLDLLEAASDALLHHYLQKYTLVPNN
ncbi:MAG: low molecular weight phosphotyrosine protein phosphatase [Vampirovibrionales bacterium]|nr:low molecular weight phosphotyrosine protein phosphatase [Vampirovibrionales bacterium]